MSHRITAEWMGTRIETLDDLVPLSPRAFIVGVNPAPSSVEAGHYYQGQLGQRLWQRLRWAGLLDDTGFDWEDDAALAGGFGFTDVVKRPTPHAADVRPDERVHGAALLRDKLRDVEAPAVIFTFKDAATSMIGRFRGAGWIDGASICGASVFVMPGPYERRDIVDSVMVDLRTRLA